MENVTYAVQHYTTRSLFSICSKAPQVDGAFGLTAALAEMLLQSQDGTLTLLPARPSAWTTGEIRGLRARGGFEVGMRWKDGRLVEAIVHSTLGGACRLRPGSDLRVTRDGRPVRVVRREPGVVEIDTAPGATYVVVN
jgi:alpha-L-fucosidase 2